MSLVVNNNLMAQNAARNLNTIFNRLSTSTQRLSSGLRVNSAADDAAGLAIRELMRADISTINQGIRNASDAISMIQTAEGAMSVIDEKLIRMKELAEQAATGTYTTAQRLIIDSEYQAMAKEIDRIATATDFNGVKLLDGSLQWGHEGSGMKIHFGTGNDSDEDYYYVSIGDMRATETTGLRVGNDDKTEVWRSTSLKASAADSIMSGSADGLLALQYTEDGGNTWKLYGYADVTAGKTRMSDLAQTLSKGTAASANVSISSGATSTQLAGDTITVNGNILTFSTTAAANSFNTTTNTGTISLAGIGSTTSITYQIASFFNNNAEEVGVYANAQSTTSLNLVAYELGEGGNDIKISSSLSSVSFSENTLRGGGVVAMTGKAFYDEETGEYELQLEMANKGENNQLRIFTTTNASGSGDVIGSGSTVGFDARLVTNAAGSTNLSSYSQLDEDSEWSEVRNGTGNTSWDGASIRTQTGAQESLAALNEAIVKKDTARANLGAIQNRLENTITQLTIQAENLQAAESRISDVDVALEMTSFTKNNILSQAATSMLAQANSLPQLALQLLGG